MKHLIWLLMPIFASFLIFGCDSGKKQLMDEYNTLLVQEDSLAANGLDLLARHQQLAQNQEELMLQLETVENPDTAFLARMQDNEVILQSQIATFEKHEQLRVAHDAFQQEHVLDDMSAPEIKAQVDQMMQDHQEMMAEHQQIYRELSEIDQEHTEAREMLEGDLVKEAGS